MQIMVCQWAITDFSTSCGGGYKGTRMFLADPYTLSYRSTVAIKSTAVLSYGIREYIHHTSSNLPRSDRPAISLAHVKNPCDGGVVGKGRGGRSSPIAGRSREPFVRRSGFFAFLLHRGEGGKGESSFLPLLFPTITSPCYDLSSFSLLSRVNGG